MSNYIVRHGTGWKYKRAVPTDLQATVGKKTWIKTLGSIAHQAAKTEGLRLAFTDDRTIAQLRRLTPAERAEIAAKGGLESYMDAAATTARDADMAAVFIDAVGSKELDPRRPAALRAQDALEIMDARQEALQMRQEASTARKALARLENGKVGANVTTLIPVWQKVSKPRSPGSVQKMHLYAGRFVEIVGDIEPKAVTRGHMIKFRDALEKREKLSRRSAAKHLEALHTLFNVALSTGLVSSNPAHGVKLSKSDGKFADENRKKPFQPSHARAIFKTVASESADFQWIVRLVAYHGMRSGEAIQLHTDDVTDLFGVPVLRVHDRHGTIKNKHSVRDIPIHPECMGIVEYAKTVQGPWLFSSFPDWGDRRSAAFQRLASDFLRKRVKILDRGLTLHSFRHLWRTLAREIDMPEAVSRSIMGHALGKDDHADYGTGPSLKVRAEWVARIDPLA